MYVLNSLEFDVCGLVFFLYLFYHVFAKCVWEVTDSSHRINLMNYIYDSESEEKTTKGKSRRRRTRRKKKKKPDSDYTKKDVLNMIKLLLKSKLVTKEYQKYSERPPEFGTEYYKQKPEPKTPHGRKLLPDPVTKVKYQLQPKIHYISSPHPVYEPEPQDHFEAAIEYHPEPKSIPPPKPDAILYYSEPNVQPALPLETETNISYHEPKPKIQPRVPPPKETYYLEPKAQAYPGLEFPSSSEPRQKLEIPPPREPEPNVETYPELAFRSGSVPLSESETDIKLQSEPDIKHGESEPEIQRSGLLSYKPELKATYYSESDVNTLSQPEFLLSSEPRSELEIQHISPPPNSPEIQRSSTPPHKPDSKISYYSEPNVEAFPELEFPSSSEPQQEPEIQQNGRPPYKPGPDITPSSEPPMEPETKRKDQPKPDTEYRKPEPKIQRSGPPSQKPEIKIAEPDVEAYPELESPSISVTPLEPETKGKDPSKPDTEYRKSEPKIQRSGPPSQKPEIKSAEPDVEVHPELESPLEPESKTKDQSKPDIEYRKPEPKIQRSGRPPRKPGPEIKYYLEPEVEATPLEPESKTKDQSEPDSEYRKPEPKIQQNGSPPRKPDPEIKYYLEPEVEGYPELEFPSSSEIPLEPETKAKYPSESDIEYVEPVSETRRTSTSTPELQDHRIPSPELKTVPQFESDNAYPDQLEPVIEPDAQHDPKPLDEPEADAQYQPEIEYDEPSAPDTPRPQPQQETGIEPQPVPKPQLESKEPEKLESKEPSLEPEPSPAMLFQPEMEYDMPPAPEEPKPEPTQPEPLLKPQLESKGQKPMLETVSEPILPAQPQPDLLPRPKPVLEPKLEPALQPELKPVLEPERKPVLEPERKPAETDTKQSLELKTQYEIEMKSESEPDIIELPHKEFEPETKLQIEMETQTDVELEYEAGHHHVTKLQLETDAEHQHVTELQLKTECEPTNEFQLKTDCEHVTDLQLEFVCQHLTKLQIVTETKHKHMTSTDHRHVTQVQLKNLTPPQSHETKPEFHPDAEPEYHPSPEPEYDKATKPEPKTNIVQVCETEAHPHPHDGEAELLRMREQQCKTQYQLEADSNTDIQLQYKSYAMCDRVTRIELGRGSSYQSEPELWRAHQLKYETAAQRQWRASETLLRQCTQRRYIPEAKCQHGNQAWLKTVKSDLHMTGLQIEAECKDEHLALLKRYSRPECLTRCTKSDSESSDQLMTELQFETDTESDTDASCVEEKTWCETLAELQFDTDSEYEYERETGYKPGKGYQFKRAPQIGIGYPPTARLWCAKETDKVCGKQTEHQHIVSVRPEAEPKPCGSVTTCQIRKKRKCSDQDKAELEQIEKTDCQRMAKRQTPCMSKLESPCMGDFQIESVPSSHLFSELLAEKDAERWNISDFMSETQTDCWRSAAPNFPQCNTDDVCQRPSAICIVPQDDPRCPLDLRDETLDDHQHVPDSEFVSDVDPPRMPDRPHECPFETPTHIRDIRDQPSPCCPRVCEETNQNNANRFILTLIIPYS